MTPNKQKLIERLLSGSDDLFSSLAKVHAEAHAAAIEAAKDAADTLGYHCVGCGHMCGDPTKDMDLLRKAGALSCCPERKMEPLSETIGALIHTDASLAAIERIKRETREEVLGEVAEIVRPKSKPKQIGSRFVSRPEPRSEAVFNARNTLAENIMAMIEKDKDDE